MICVFLKPLLCLSIDMNDRNVISIRVKKPASSAHPQASLAEPGVSITSLVKSVGVATVLFFSKRRPPLQARVHGRSARY